MTDKVEIINEIYDYAVLHRRNEYLIPQIAPSYMIVELLGRVKPDVFYPLKDSNVIESMCDRDPGTWVIINTKYMCQAWKNGNCNNLKERKDGTLVNCCKFNHAYGDYISVEIVNTKKMLKIYTSKIMSIRKNILKKGIDIYTDPFTGKFVKIQ